MLLRLAHLASTNAFALVRLLPMSDRDKDTEMLVLRHQLLVLQRQAGKPVFTNTDRAVLAGLLHHLPTNKLRRVLLLVHPDTILRWHRRPAQTTPCRNLRAQSAADVHPQSRSIPHHDPPLGQRESLVGVSPNPRRTRRPRYQGRRLHRLGSPQRTRHPNRPEEGRHILGRGTTRLRSLPDAHPDRGAPLRLEHSTRRIRTLDATAHPTMDWIVQLGRNLLMDLAYAGDKARFLIRDRDSKVTAAFGALMTDAGLKVVTAGIRLQRMNSRTERWIQTCRRELLDHTLIWNQSHLLHALREFEAFYNEHRPHRALDHAAPLRPLPHPINGPTQIGYPQVRQRDQLGGTLYEYQRAS